MIAIQDLVGRVDHFQQDSLIQQDLAAVPAAIQTLERRIAAESDQVQRDELTHNLQNHQKQLAALEQLRDLADRAEIQIESTLSALGALYSHMLAGQSASHVADYQHLSTGIDEEIHLLQDHLEALQEVKLRAG